MKKVLSTLGIALASYCAYAQTNTFPTIGNVGVGTTSPAALFSVGPSSQFQVNSSGTATIGGNLNIAGTLQSYGPGAIGSNTVMGDLALSANTTGSQNVALGFAAGKLFQTGNYNVFVGFAAASAGTGTGNYNNGIGYNALSNLSSGAYNNAFGAGAGGGITTGISNTMMGDGAGGNVTTANNNTGIGYSAGMNSNGTNWTAIGAYALQSGSVLGKDGSTAVGMKSLQITTGTYNTAVGYQSGYNDGTTLTGSYNNYLGTSSGRGIVTGSYNTILGSNTSIGDVNNYVIIADGQGHNRIVADNNGNVGIGITLPAFSLDVGGKIGINGGQVAYLPNQTDFLGTLVIGNGGGALTHTSGGDGFQNTFVGLNNGTANTTGFRNTALGNSSFLSNTTGVDNVAIGVQALAGNTSGTSNLAAGTQALQANTTGNYNIGIGQYALYANTSGNYNTAVGLFSLRGVTTGTLNTAMGWVALGGVNTGSNNTAIGNLAGNYIADGSTQNTTGSNSVFLGVNTEARADGDTNEIVIGYNAVGLGSNTVVLGNSSITKTELKGNVAIGTTDPKGYKLAVNGSAIAESMTVKLHGSWPDYVFKKEYTLPALSDVKTYIDKNQHLPGMPAAQEVAKNGVNLGEIVKVQTKKIEELTLYMIEKDRQVKDQDTRIKALEKALAKLTTVK